MIYLPKNEKQARSNLGTTFYKPKSELLMCKKIGFASKPLSPESERKLKKDLYFKVRTRFQETCTVFFFRSNTSWHSFEYDQGDLGPRISLNVNFFFPPISPTEVD